ncbi:hypothetical protein NC652_036839 [Populus alba x Populus x berolinensis]|nr:hypothetical protein NC652_036839 [Populus alba x Populus x berolinensis]
MVSPRLEPLFHSIQLLTVSVRCNFFEILMDEISEVGVFTCKSVPPPPPRRPQKLDGGFISFSPTLFVKDLLFVWPNGISGFSFVHIHIVHITIISVDFSANPDGAGFFEGLTT